MRGDVSSLVGGDDPSLIAAMIADTIAIAALADLDGAEADLEEAKRRVSARKKALSRVISAAIGLACSAQRHGGGGLLRDVAGELRGGVNYKPEVPNAIEGFVVRPEIRYDSSLNGTKPFNAGKSDHQVTVAADVVLPF